MKKFLEVVLFDEDAEKLQLTFAEIFIPRGFFALFFWWIGAFILAARKVNPLFGRKAFIVAIVCFVIAAIWFVLMILKLIKKIKNNLNKH